MKVLILAGGFGTRLSEETSVLPKPMLEIGGKPILWHIMKIYSHYGYNDFIILLGYKGYIIKEYFSNYFLHQSDVKIDLKNNSMEILNCEIEPWKVTLLDTGLDTMTGGRIKRAQKYVGDKTFLLTYGDGVADINIKELIQFHRSNGKAMTLTALRLESRFGTLQFERDNIVTDFIEKPEGEGSWINAGFFVCEPRVFEYINEGDATIFERAPLENLAKEKELVAYRHNGFWQCMDTLRDKIKLNALWEENHADWKIW